MLPCFPALSALYRNTWPAFGFWGGAVMQVSGGCCKIARASVIVMEGCTKRTPSESSSIAEPCLSKLTIIKTVFDTSKNCISRTSTSMRGRAMSPWGCLVPDFSNRDGTGYPGAVPSRPVPGFSNNHAEIKLVLGGCIGVQYPCDNVNIGRFFVVKWRCYKYPSTPLSEHKVMCTAHGPFFARLR